MPHLPLWVRHQVSYASSKVGFIKRPYDIMLTVILFSLEIIFQGFMVHALWGRSLLIGIRG